jgi:hypothetical protein
MIVEDLRASMKITDLDIADIDSAHEVSTRLEMRRL